MNLSQSPAFLLGVSALAGLSLSLFPEGYLAAIIWLLLLVATKKWLPICCWFVFAAYGAHVASQGVVGPVSGTFVIDQFKRHQSPFYQDLAYHGHLKVSGKRVPCTFYRKTADRIRADRDYEINGVLQKRGQFDYVLKPKELHAIDGSWSLAELRFQAKEWLRSFLQKHLSSRQSSTLLFALVGGEVDERILRHQFSRVGLQHILAISGFHFGLLISFLSSLLGLFVRRHFRWGAILVGMGLYFLFIGAAPAVERAWISATLFFAMKWLKKDAEPLNLLGCALLIELCIHPFSPTSLGFQLSYLSCFGILVFFKPLQELLLTIFPKRRFSEAVREPIQDQILFLLASFFRNGIAISVAVNGAILPLLLFHFGNFPPLSLLYNLFYPQLIGALLFFFLIAAGVHLLVPALAIPLFWALNGFAKILSDLVAYPPPLLDHPIHLGPIPPWTIPLYLIFLVLLGYLTDRPKLDKMDPFYGGRSSVG